MNIDGGIVNLVNKYGKGERAASCHLLLPLFGRFLVRVNICDVVIAFAGKAHEVLACISKNKQGQTDCGRRYTESSSHPPGKLKCLMLYKKGVHSQEQERSDGLLA